MCSGNGGCFLKKREQKNIHLHIEGLMIYEYTTILNNVENMFLFKTKYLHSFILIWFNFRFHCFVFDR